MPKIRWLFLGLLAAAPALLTSLAFAHSSAQALAGTGAPAAQVYNDASAATDRFFSLPAIPAGGTATPTGPPCGGPPVWCSGAVYLPGVMVRAVGVFFPANGRFYVMGGRSSDTAGSDYTNPREYDPISDTWVTKAAVFPDNQVNNMACGVLPFGGGPRIICVGGSAAAATTSTGRVFAYDPVGDSITSIATDPWPEVANTLPGGFTVFSSKLYILGGFSINIAMTDRIWEFNPAAAAGMRWTQKMAVLPVALGYVPATSIGTLIFTAGGSTFTAPSTLTDSTNSYVYNPVGDAISPIASIPRATAETRAVNVLNEMWVLGGGRTAPNPSSEVDIYNPTSGMWRIGLPFALARRNFAADSDGSRVWLVGGYAPTAPTDDMQIYVPSGHLVTGPAAGGASVARVFR